MQQSEAQRSQRHQQSWSKRQRQRLTDWLETRWVNPDYKALLLGGLALFFFLAASNTMAGWLYVMSGVSLALLAIAAYLTRRSLQGLSLSRAPLPTVSVGQDLRLDLTVTNTSAQAKSLMQVQDPLPAALGGTETSAIALIAPRQDQSLQYSRLAQARGVYVWHSVTLRSAAPLGLFWYRRSLPVKAKAIVYPHVFPLASCPLVDALGNEQNPNMEQVQRSQSATEGLTRALRPYRWGDPIRMVHWKTSARYGELRVRELETLQAGQEVVLALDSAGDWTSIDTLELGTAIPVANHQINSFEQAVSALASMYRYASRHHERVRIWTAESGLVNGDRRILETLAAVQPGQSVHPPSDTSPNAPSSTPGAKSAEPNRLRQPVIWLTQDPSSLSQLPAGSRWLLWPNPATARQRPPSSQRGLVIDPTQPLQPQLQASLKSSA